MERNKLVADERRLLSARAASSRGCSLLQALLEARASATARRASSLLQPREQPLAQLTRASFEVYAQLKPL
jgi:hypothetical protein